MKSGLLNLGATFLLGQLILPTIAISHAADDKSAMDPKMAEQMKAWEEFAKIGETHKTLATMAGNWKYVSTYKHKPDGKEETSTGTSTIKMILGSHFLQQDVKGTAMGRPFQGLGLVGYDNLKKRYENIWMDNMGTGIVHGTGTYDADSKTFTDRGEFSCPLKPNNTQEYRSEWKIIDKDHHSYTMWVKDDHGKEFKQMEMTYTRAK